MLILIISIATLIGCTKEESRPKIRLSNISPYDFKNIVVNTTTGNTDFGNLNSGQKTEYKVFERAYSYAFVELEIEGKTYTLQPIDYVGESTLENGNYTYQLDANDPQEEYGILSLTFIED